MSIQSAFQTEVATMDVAARHVDEVAAAIQAEMQSLDNRIQPITGSWRGAGASAYMALHLRWMENSKQLQQVLREISQGITTNAQRYQVSEDEVVAQMGRTASQL